MLEEPGPVGPLRKVSVLVLGDAGGDEFLRLSSIADGDDGAIAGAGERAGAYRDLVQDGLKVKGPTDTHTRHAQP